MYIIIFIRLFFMADILHFTPEMIIYYFIVFLQHFWEVEPEEMDLYIFSLLT